MCSITGFTWEDRDLLKKMTDILSYRGPDSQGFYTDKNISLGHNRLAIVDLSKAGHQPMTRDSTTIIFNGEIYNHHELRQQLEPKYNFQSDSDTEVLIFGFKEWGFPSLLSKLNGMFAFAIWDNNTLYLARDRLGIKPLYYATTKHGLLFSSEIKSLLQNPEVKKDLNLPALNSYLKYRFITSDDTVLKSIKKLQPGHYAIYQNNQLTIQKYWDLKFNIQNRPEQYFIKKFRSLLKDSVEKRLMSDVPLGAYLSGGLDSSLICAINSKLREDPVKTFTVGFGHETDEFRHARTVAEHLNTDHHELFLNYDNMTKALPKIVWYMDEPNSDITMVPLYFLSQFSRKKVTVVNTGEGADELFSGYQHFRVGSPSFNLVPNAIKATTYNLYYSPFKSWHRKKLFNHQQPEDNILKQTLKQKTPKHLLNRILNFDIKYELPGWQLHRVDRMTMAHAQEARVPFLDHRMVEFSATVPINLKLKSLEGKYLIKKAVKPLLPRAIIQRKKQGFTTPRDEWINKDLHNLADQLLSKKNIQKRNIFNYKQIEKLKNKAFTKGDRPFCPHSYRMMILALFELWCQQYLD